MLLQVGFNRRYDPSHREVRDRVAAGDVGELHLVRITSRDPAPPPIAYIEVSGGIFCDMTIHDFDMARFVTGREIDRGLRHRRRAGRPGHRRTPATSTRPSSSCSTPTA